MWQQTTAFKIGSQVVVRRFLTVFLPLSAVAAGIFAAIYHEGVKNDTSELMAKETGKVKLQSQLVTRNFEPVISDLMVFATHTSSHLVNYRDDRPQHETLAQAYQILAKYKKLYHRIQLLDQTGKESIRVDFIDNQSPIAKQVNSPTVKDNLDLKQLYSLAKEEVYISPLFLDFDQSKANPTPKPLITFGTPIFNSQGQKQGVLIFQHFGEKILQNFSKPNHNYRSESMLLNGEGFWLKGTNPAEEWGFMYPERQNQTFKNRFAREWQKISQLDSGQFQTADGIFTFETVYPLLEAQKYNQPGEQVLTTSKINNSNRTYNWKIVSRLSPEVLNSRATKLVNQLAQLYSGLIVLIGLAAWWLVLAQESRQLAQAELEQSEAEIAALAQQKDLLNRRLSSQILNSLDLETILNNAVREIRSLLQIDRCQFLWYQVEEEELNFDLQYEACNPDLSSLPKYTSESATKIIGETILQLALLPQGAFCHRDILGERGWQCRLVQVDSIAAEPRISQENQQQLLEMGITSLLAVSLHTNSGRIGAIVCEDGNRLHHWHDDEIEALQAIADQLAIAIDQSELYHQSRAAAAVAIAQAEQLSVTLENLKQAQTQLIQSEKMSSLGMLVAGVAHEINNPINFIYGNLSHADEYAQELLALVDLYQKYYPQPAVEIQDRIENSDLDFLRGDLPKLLASMKVGAERIREIVLTLRNFSRLDEAAMKPVDIKEGIDSTLLILQNRLKEKSNFPLIKIVKEYGDLPLVTCYAGQLNQVFMNIIGNAIDAIEQCYPQYQLNGIPAPASQITIRTELSPSGSHARIIIADNGLGMSEEVRSQLFDPFFTTKPVGKGTGLGLSISYQIVVEKHNGAIWCVSELGKGTEFYLEIPLGQEQIAAVNGNGKKSATSGEMKVLQSLYQG